MSIEELKEKKIEMEQRISVVMKEFEQLTDVKIGAIDFSRCTTSDDFGIEKDYSYNIETQIRL